MTIYNRIWNADENGFVVTSIGADGMPVNSNADIVLNEQIRASGRRAVDLATQPLFNFVKETKFEKDTYQHFINLLDNYALNTREREEVTEQERQEEVAFLSACMATEPMKLAFEHVTTQLGFNLSEDEFLTETRNMWFEIFTNYYNGNSTHYCSGFEHVFVGEGKYSPRTGASSTKGEISGYHSWIKFYLDEKYNRVNYLGYKYDLGGAGPDQPCVVTLQMIWNHQSMQGDLVAELFKKKGGFFVGRSPECEFALGTVAMFESRAGVVSGDRIPVILNDGHFDLVIYRSVEQSGRRGLYIRSFYPAYKGSTRSIQVSDNIDNTPADRTTVRPVNPSVRNNRDISIVKAMINPTGQDDQGEWVELKNNTEVDIDMTGYELRDKLSRPQPITGQLAANQIMKVDITRLHHHRMQLGNRGGLITLHKGEELISAVVYSRNQEGVAVKFNTDGRPSV